MSGVKHARRALTIAGSDSGGGAGIQADLKTFQELEIFGLSAITAVTAQNSLGVQAVYPLPAEAVKAQIDAVLADIGADAVKTGMLLSAEIVACVADAVRKYRIEQLIVDPVRSAKDGSALLRREAMDAMKEELFPLAAVVTPNIPEACELLGIDEALVQSLDDMTEAAYSLLALGPRYVLLKGGHLKAAGQHQHDSESARIDHEAVDVLVGDKLKEPVFLRAPRIATKHTHGTGCTTAAAIAAYAASGCSIPKAACMAKRFVTAAIAGSGPLGQGIGSLWHAAHRQLEREQNKADRAR